MLAKRSPLWIFLHTLAIGCVLVSLLTGLRIASMSNPAVAYFSALLPQGNMHWPHFLSAALLTAVALSYALVRTLGTKAYSYTPNHPIQHYHRWITRSGYLLVIFAITSGTLQLFDSAFQSALTELHFTTALGFLGYLLLHGGVYFVQQGKNVFLHILKPTVNRTALRLFALPIAIAALLIIYTTQFHQKTLIVPAINLEQAIDIDGTDNETAWQTAREISVQTQGGANFIHGESRVSLKALHNNEEIFFYITWQDPTESLKHLPLLKTPQGWQVQQNGFYQFDETEYYEDKFAILLSESCEFAASGTAHLGPKPLKNKPGNWHGRGYHYAPDNRIRDLWHWKAERTNAMQLMDDNYIGAPEPARPAQRRYTAGYHSDAKESGAYVMNWQWYSPHTVVPKRLPRNPESLPPYQTTQNTSLSWVIPWFDYEPYDKRNDTYPAGTVLPSVMYNSNRFEGDRADIRAHGVWHNGYWHLEIVRKLRTHSEKDIAIKNGVCLWVAAFDHAQTAHTRHQQAIRLRMH